MTVGMKSLGEGTKGSTQLMVGKALPQVDSAQTLKLEKRVPLCRREPAGPYGAGGRIASSTCDRNVTRMRPVCPKAGTEPTGWDHR